MEAGFVVRVLKVRPVDNGYDHAAHGVCPALGAKICVFAKAAARCDGSGKNLFFQEGALYAFYRVP
eukprot:9197580-Alexandrium_andersonii.AAC.1